MAVGVRHLTVNRADAGTITSDSEAISSATSWLRFQHDQDALAATKWRRVSVGIDAAHHPLDTIDQHRPTLEFCVWVLPHTMQAGSYTLSMRMPEPFNCVKARQIPIGWACLSHWRLADSSALASGAIQLGRSHTALSRCRPTPGE